MEITVNKLHHVGHLGQAMQGDPEGHSLAEVSLQVWELHGVQAGVHHHLVQYSTVQYNTVQYTTWCRLASIASM